MYNFLSIIFTHVIFIDPAIDKYGALTDIYIPL